MVYQIFYVAFYRDDLDRHKTDLIVRPRVAVFVTRTQQPPALGLVEDLLDGLPPGRLASLAALGSWYKGLLELVCHLPPLAHLWVVLHPLHVTCVIIADVFEGCEQDVREVIVEYAVYIQRNNARAQVSFIGSQFVQKAMDSFIKLARVSKPGCLDLEPWHLPALLTSPQYSPDRGEASMIRQRKTTT